MKLRLDHQNLYKVNSYSDSVVKKLIGQLQNGAKHRIIIYGIDIIYNYYKSQNLRNSV